MGRAVMRSRFFLSASFASLVVVVAPRVALANDAVPGTWVDGDDDAALPQLPAPKPATTAPAGFAHVRTAIVEGRLAAARDELDALAVSPDAETRAAAVELRAVVEAWIARGGRAGENVAVVVPHEPPSPWKDSFDLARIALVTGRNAQAARRFADLAHSAPDATHAAKARALGELATSLAATDAGAGAEEPAPAPQAYVERQDDDDAGEPKTKKHWYGWQTLIADGASIVTVPLGGVGVAGYFLAAPVVHAAHGRWGIAAADVGVRVALPLTGCYVGAALSDDRGEFAGLGECILGGALGITGAIALDAALFAREDVEVAPKKKERGHLAWTPTLAPRKEGGVSIGLGGTF